MIVLICGDIHGNLPALEKLLETEKGNYDMLICHGDVVNYGPWGNECVELLDSLSQKILLKGNHELAFLKGSYDGNNLTARAFFQFCYPKFRGAHSIECYQSFYDLGNARVTHTILDKYIFPDTELEVLDRNYFIGHSHYQFSRYIGRNFLVNTGSVGQNRLHINVCSYAVYDTDTVAFQLKNFTFDIDVVINKMRADNYPALCVDYYNCKNRITG